MPVSLVKVVLKQVFFPYKQTVLQKFCNSFHPHEKCVCFPGIGLLECGYLTPLISLPCAIVQTYPNIYKHN